MKKLLPVSLLGLLLAAGPAFAQTATTTATLPEWDKLSPQQREALIAPLRDRWNNGAPEDRTRMFEHAKRWQEMPPEMRKQARRGMHRYEHMNPEQREQARALFGKMRDMSPEQRKQLTDQWKAMTPEQRRAWIEKNPPPKDMPPPPMD